MEKISKRGDDFLRVKPAQLSSKDFEIGEVLGTGSFARVKIAKHLKTKKFYALKILKKEEIIKLKQVDHIMNEMRILNNISHPFIIKLEGYFQDDKRLYLVEELVNGGELFTYLGMMGCLGIESAKFYAGQIVLIFEYLHSKNLIYRDLKPENVLINKGGYIKLCDFGFSKYCDSRTYTLCGTPEYLAPESLLNKGHGRSVDWWTLGVLLYELLVGIDPFADDDPLNVYKKILSGKVKFPKNFDKVARHLIKKLLKIDLSKRFGNLVGGVNDIKYHKFFSIMNFDKLFNMEIKPPYVPKVTTSCDISNFPVYPDSKKEIASVNPKEDPFLSW